MAHTLGTTIETTVTRVVDGDTIVVPLAGEQESLRLLCLDTEESRAGSHKPMTPWGKQASEHAHAFFQPGAAVTLEFPGIEAFDECLVRYRDNYGRLLVFVHLGNVDFQEHMIRLGYSPYFNKYGHADFDEHRRRYLAAERAAQGDHIGVWNQIEVNGSQMRDYATLGVWWSLRAELVDGFRRRRAEDPTLLDSRLDYARIRELAAAEQEATIFTELAGYTRIGQSHAIVDIGSRHQPFKLFLPDADGAEGQALLTLLDACYVGSDERVGRSYAFVRGAMKLFRDEPELVVTGIAQIGDEPPG